MLLSRYKIFSVAVLVCFLFSSTLAHAWSVGDNVYVVFGKKSDAYVCDGNIKMVGSSNSLIDFRPSYCPYDDQWIDNFSLHRSRDAANKIVKRLDDEHTSFGEAVNTALWLGVGAVLLNELFGGSSSSSSRSSSRSSSSSSSYNSSSNYDRDNSDPKQAIYDYYKYLNSRNPSQAYKYFRIGNRSYDKWKRDLYSTAGCAKVNSAKTTSRSGNSASVKIDLCVEDTKANAVHRWVGSMGTSWISGAWRMSSWTVKRGGYCNSSCRP